MQQVLGMQQVHVLVKFITESKFQTRGLEKQGVNSVWYLDSTEFIHFIYGFYKF